MPRPSILLVDDSRTTHRLIEKALQDTELQAVRNGAEALTALANRPYDVVITDLRVKGTDGLEVLRTARERWPGTEVVVLESAATAGLVGEALARGAFDSVSRPLSTQAVARVVGHALERRKLREEVARLRRELDEVPAFEVLLGSGRAMSQVRARLDEAASLDVSVLVTGEAGTGKELAARALHARSHRRLNPFVTLSCTEPEALLESRLFPRQGPGLFDEAAGGTLFLDEVGELPDALQSKLARALKDRSLRRGGPRLDVRVVASTRRELRQDVKSGRFREDLLLRLNVFPLRLPPLRERREDLPELARAFLLRMSKRWDRDVAAIDPEVLRLLAAHRWPGNVRELENVLERAVVHTKGRTVSPEALPAELREGHGTLLPADLLRLPWSEAMAGLQERAGREYLSALLREAGGHVTRAAERAGLERVSLHRLLRRHGIEPANYRARDEVSPDR